MGAEVVVAVDVLGELRRADKPLNIITVILRTVDIYDSQITEMKLKKDKPDLLIRPDMGDMSQYKVKNFEVAFDAGYKAGMENADKIKELLK
ncbi:MAG: patatin-like phospholipase family protein [Eubacteriales bacterium]